VRNITGKDNSSQ